MNLEELRDEVKDRGFSDISEARLSRWINLAYQTDICEEEDWPFLEASKEGAAPLEVADLRSIESVVDVTQDIVLKPMDRRAIIDSYDPDLTTKGTPQFYYRTGLPTVSVYPANTTDTLKVRYFKFPPALEAGEEGEDEPLLPARFHYLIVEAAVIRAYRNRDNMDNSLAAQTEFERGLQLMRMALMNWNHDQPSEFVVVTDPGTEA